MKPNILVSSYYAAEVTDPELQRLAPFATVNRATLGRRLDEAELLAHLEGVQVALISDEVFNERVFQSALDLRMIVTDGVGVDSIDLPAATRHGVIVNNAPYVHEANGDFTIGLILAVTRRIVSSDKAVRAGQWNERSRFIGRDLGGSTLGLLGFGRAARTVAKRASGFGLKTIAYSPHADKEVARELGVEIVSYDELLASSDILSIHITLNDSTRDLIGAKDFAKMKPGAFFINTSRGAIVDETALIESLNSGHLAGAGLDVFRDEPPSVDNPLFHMDNVVVTPHIASDSLDAFRAVFAGAVDDILLYLNGETPRHIMNPAVLERIEITK